MDLNGSIEPSDDEDQDMLEGSGQRSPPPPPPFAAAVGGSVRSSTSSSPGHARLGLHFSGGSGLGNTAPLCWRDGRFSDWTVQVGEKAYHLHAFLLARASHFFESHMSMAARTAAEAEASGVTPSLTRGSDLTEVLPQSCHSAFEDTLDFIYSENQASFEAPASKALLLLKIADILGIGGLFEAMGRRIETAFSDTAPLLLEQYCRFHIPGTDDGAALRQIRDGAVELIVRKFQPFLANPEMRTALLRLPATVLSEILEADDLLAACEDAVFDFVAARMELCDVQDGLSEVQEPTMSTPLLPGEGSTSVAGSSAAAQVEGTAGCTLEVQSTASAAIDDTDDIDVLWKRVRWAHLSAVKFAQALAPGQRMLRQEVALHALTARASRLDLGGAEAFASHGPQPGLVPPRRPILPPGVPPPTSTEIDFCFHYARADQYTCGDALRSQPKRIGDVVLRVLVFPAGTDTGVARGSLSVFLEAVPQPHWPRDWEFANIRYAIACIRWPTGSGETWAAKRKSDLWTFKANRLDRGWHDFLAPGEIHRYLGPDGYVCLRGHLETECLQRSFLLNAQTGQSGYPGAGGEAAGSSQSRRAWAPRPSASAE